MISTLQSLLLTIFMCELVSVSMCLSICVPFWTSTGSSKSDHSTFFIYVDIASLTDSQISLFPHAYHSLFHFHLKWSRPILQRSHLTFRKWPRNVVVLLSNFSTFEHIQYFAYESFYALASFLKYWASRTMRVNSKCHKQTERRK